MAWNDEAASWREPEETFEGTIAPAALITFNKHGHTASIDIVDGKLVYSGDVEITAAAKSLFEALVGWVDDRWLERAASKASPAR